MDILLDEYNMDVTTFLSNPNGRFTTFRLILSAEDENGGNSLQREITVNTSQYGIRSQGDHWNGFAYVGAFFRENEVENELYQRNYLGWRNRIMLLDIGKWRLTIHINLRLF